MKTRKIVSLTLGISFVTSSITGIILYFVPKGKNAFWSAWEIFGLTKQQWINLHITLSVLLLIFGIWHTVLNWKSIVNYMKNKLKKVSLYRTDFLIALALNVVFIIGTLFMVPPFGTLINIKAGIEQRWSEKLGEPPYGHAEESSLKLLTKRMDIDLNIAMQKLKKKEIKIENENESIIAIASNNHLTPQKIYDAIKSEAQNSGPNKRTVNHTGIPARLGRKTLKELSDEGNIDLNKTFNFLKSKDIQATSDMTMRELANNLGISPFDLYHELKKQK